MAGRGDPLGVAGRWREGTSLQCLRAEVRALAAQVLTLKEQAAEVERVNRRSSECTSSLWQR